MDFHGGSVVKNPLAIAGDTGWVSGPGRTHTLWSNSVHAPQLLSPCSRARPTRCSYGSRHALEPELCSKRSHHNQKLAHHNQSSPRSPQREKSPSAATKIQHSQKYRHIFIVKKQCIYKTESLCYTAEIITIL